MTFLALLVSGLLIWIIIWAIRGTKANETVVAAILASAATVGVAILTSGLSSYTSKEKEIRDAYRLQKIGVYTQFVDLVISTIQETKNLPSQEMDESEYQAESERYGSQLIAEDVRTGEGRCGTSNYTWKPLSEISTMPTMRRRRRP